MHGEESDVFSDAGYQGVEKRSENQGSTAEWHIAMKRGKRRRCQDAMGKPMERFEKLKGQHPCEGRAPVSCSEESLLLSRRSLPRSRQNEAQPFSLFGLENLVLARKRLMTLDAQVRPDASV